MQYPNVPIDRCVTPSALTVLVLSAKSDEETSDRLDGQDASRSLSVDGEAVPGGEQAPTQGRPPHPLTLTCPLCERETSQTVFINKTTEGLVCPPCKVHGELMGGLSCPMHCSESIVGLGCCRRGGGVYSKVCQFELVPNWLLTWHTSHYSHAPHHTFVSDCWHTSHNCHTVGKGIFSVTLASVCCGGGGSGGEGSVVWSVISKLAKSHNVLGGLSCPMHCSESVVGQECCFAHNTKAHVVETSCNQVLLIDSATLYAQGCR